MRTLAYLILCMPLLFACSTGKQQFQQGNYEEAVRSAVNKLRNSPNNKKARETLAQAFPLATEYHLNNIKRLETSTERFKWDQIASSYATLNNLNQEIMRCPACREVLPKTRGFENQYNEAAAKAADERYDAGIELLAMGDRESAKDAFRNFARVEQLSPNYKDTRRKMDDAKYMATLKVLVEQIPVHSAAFGISNEFFQNKIYEFLAGENINEFVRFYTPAEAQAEQLNQPDQIVKLQFDDFVVGQLYFKESSRQITRDSVVVGKIKIGEETQDVYGSVSATYTLYRKSLLSQGLLDMIVFDANTDRVLMQNKMPGSYEWVSEWANFKGDERALTDAEFNTTKLKEAQPPSPQDLFISFTQPIFSQTTSQFRSFYRNY